MWVSYTDNQCEQTTCPPVCGGGRNKEINMSDLIDRQALIDDIDKLLPIDPLKDEYTQGRTVGLALAMERIKQAPANNSEIPNSSDTISRQQAIDALDKRFDSIPMEQTSEILMLRKDLRNLPPAQPKTGKWALQSDDYHEYYECDQCGMAVGLDDVRNFCPNCGADMREVTT